MKMTFLELRRNPRKMLAALKRNEAVTLLRRGLEIGRIVPAAAPTKKQTMKMCDHPAFGMWKDRKDMENPTEWVRKIRQSRYRDL